MSRLFLAILLVVLLSISVPQLRERAMPKYRAFGDWAWVHLEGPLTPALTPLRRTKTQTEMSQVINRAVNWRNRGFPPPETADLPEFMRAAGLDSTATDEWGLRYQVEIRPDSIYLRSGAQDRTLNTEDDMVVALRYPSPYRLNRPGRRPRR